MKREIEDELRVRTVAGEYARDVLADLLARGSIASLKQGWRTLEKWSRRGRWDYGTTIDLGWPVNDDGTPVLRPAPPAATFAEAEAAARARASAPAAGSGPRLETPPARSPSPFALKVARFVARALGAAEPR